MCVHMGSMIDFIGVMDGDDDDTLHTHHIHDPSPFSFPLCFFVHSLIMDLVVKR